MLQIQDTITELVTFPFPRRLVYFEALNTTLQLLGAMLKAHRKNILIIHTNRKSCKMLKQYCSDISFSVRIGKQFLIKTDIHFQHK